MQLLARPFLPFAPSLPFCPSLSAPLSIPCNCNAPWNSRDARRSTRRVRHRDSGAAVGVFNVSISTAWKWAKCLHKNHSAPQKRVKRAIVKRELRIEPPRSNFAFSSLWATGMKSLWDRCGVPTPHSGAGVVSLLSKLKQDIKSCQAVGFKS